MDKRRVGFISSAQFFKRLKSNDWKPEGLLEIDDQITFNDQKIISEFQEIKNVGFNDIVRIKGIDLKCGIRFVNCVFKKGIVFENVKSSEYKDSYNTNNTNIDFIECQSERIDIIQMCNFSRGVLIKNCEQIEKFYFQDSKADNSGLIINNSNITQLLDIHGSKFKLEISGCKSFNGALRLSNSDLPVSFKESSFDGHIQFWWLRNSKLILNNSSFKSEFKTTACRFSMVSVIGNEFYREFNLNFRDQEHNLEGEIDELYCSEVNFLEGFTLNGWGRKINKLTLPMTPNFKGLFKVENLSIEETKLIGVNQNSKLIFRNIDFRHLNLINFTNFNDINFLKCRGIEDSSFILANVDLGNTKFNNFSFNSFDKIQVENLSIDKISASNVEWFDDEKLIIEIEDENNTSKGRREVYRQLKKALKSDGNTIDSLEFQAKELKAFRSELWEKRSFQNIGDIIILGFSWTNSYGLNWRKPLRIIFLITLLFYILVTVLTSEKLSFCLNLDTKSIEITLLELWEKKKVFFQLFDPTRKLKQVYGTINNDWIYFLDYFHRIILGLFIFQIIRAFRKYFIR